MFTRALVPVDGSPEATIAARLASHLLPESGELTLLHVSSDGELLSLEALDAASSAVSGVSTDFITQRRIERADAGTKLLNAARADLHRPGRIEEMLVEGRTVDGILNTLDSPRFDAVVVGTRGRGMIARALLGSVSDAVLRHATKPTIIARHPEVSRILVAIDGSPGSMNAAELAGILALRSGALVHLVHAVEFPVGTYEAERVALEASFRSRAEDHFAAAAGRIGQAPPASADVLFQEPVHAICEEAERIGADLIVVGRRGVSNSSRVPVGSVSHRVALRSHASVLVAPS